MLRVRSPVSIRRTRLRFFLRDVDGAKVEPAEPVVGAMAASSYDPPASSIWWQDCAITSRTSRQVRLGLAARIWAHTPAAMAQAAEVKPKSLV